jgi:hypothetical protein
MFDPGTGLDINCGLTIIKIKAKLITYNLPITIVKSEFVTFYLNISKVGRENDQPQHLGLAIISKNQ